MDLRQAVAFAILMGADMRAISHSYAREKLLACHESPVAEAYLDTPNLIEFQDWARRWGLDWDKERDLSRPIAELREEEENVRSPK